MWFGWTVVSNPLAGWWGKNKRTVLIVGVVIVVVWGYLGTRDRPKTQRVSLPGDYASAGRELLVQAPSDPANPLPLVLILHDDNADAKSLDRQSDAGKLANSRDFAVAFPEAVGGTWRIDGPEGADVRYLRDVVRFVSTKRTKVDPNRVYVWGIGEGARLALTAACAPGKPEFAAVGVVGQFDPEPGPTCQDRVPEGRAPEASWDRKVSETLWKFSSGHRLGA
ncbi:plasmid partitioning protein [Frankia sp. CcI156]|uniref:PHB depolymerase family esterase n=1 Tax=Frankia TaxID=1854 RepID=UPI0003CFC4E7|nr:MULTISPECIES: PHB depolymerase family esterase [unclassified Frankia]ETA03622.1 hypothetical protein CcI6DRAFT_00776 [Frankia sp. CcI6]EYT90364.1 hypothetical protein ThrDRAFT_04009 [Frankia casuarinae]KDA43930.1 hypothetical protein BMG523Draft_01315 [Frankia sp. BMG5.23]KEZ37395.1 hypothetical protein CEDDRAFT_01349 [Frankia sp. CeD]OAA26975.1 polyhydroxybutyrate depolymerase [Frankia casuarinae]